GPIPQLHAPRRWQRRGLGRRNPQPLKIGRTAARLHRTLEGTPRPSPSRGRRVVGTLASHVPTQPLPETGRETGIAVGLKVFLIPGEGKAVENPRHDRKAERELKKAQKRVCKGKVGSNRRRKAVELLEKRHQRVRRQRTDFHHKTALALVRQKASRT